MAPYILGSYSYLLRQMNPSTCVHVGTIASPLSGVAGRFETFEPVAPEVFEPNSLPSSPDVLCFIETDDTDPALLRAESPLIAFLNSGGTLAGDGYLLSEVFGAELLVRFRDWLTVFASDLWVISKSFEFDSEKASRCRGAMFVPCHSDLWRFEENLAWRADLCGPLDVHVIDDNHAPMQMEQLEAISRQCGWYYHRMNQEPHSSVTRNRSQGIDYTFLNRLVYDTFVRLGSDYDYVVKVDTDVCFLTSNWWEEFAGKLGGTHSMLGTFDFRLFDEVQRFWQLTEEGGNRIQRAEVPMHLQGGLFGMSQSAIQALAEFGWLEGRHMGLSDDAKITFIAEHLQIDIRPSVSVGSWSRLKRPPLEAISHLRAIHPLVRSEWERHKQNNSRDPDHESASV